MMLSQGYWPSVTHKEPGGQFPAAQSHLPHSMREVRSTERGWGQQKRDTTSWDLSALWTCPDSHPHPKNRSGRCLPAAAPPHSSRCHRHKASERGRTLPGLSLLTEATAGKGKPESGKMHLGSNRELQQCWSITVSRASLVLTFYRQFPKQGLAISGLYFSCNF